MARIVLSTIGTRGDLNPFLALGQGLRERGHEVLFAVEEVFCDPLIAEGFKVHPLPGDVLSALTPHVGLAVGGLTPVASIRVIVQNWLIPTLRAKTQELVTACRRADLLVARAVHFAAPIAAERAGIPWVQLSMTPLTVPSSYVDPQLLPMRLPRLPRVANRIAWAAITAVGRRLADDSVNEVRAEFGLAPGRDHMFAGNHSRTLTAVMVSPAFMPPPPDWPPYVRMTGYSMWDTPGSWREPAELTDFLRAGAPVVAVSFGSMAPFVGGALDRLYRVSLGAVSAAGARALIIGAAPGTLPDRLPDGTLALPFVPFSRVYPHCAAVIHHGGPYTVAEALRAGVGSLVVPWGLDQFFTAAQVQRLGAGRWVHHRSFTPSVARRELSILINDGTYRARIGLIAEQIRRENGVATLCDAIDEVVK